MRIKDKEPILLLADETTEGKGHKAGLEDHFSSMCWVVKVPTPLAKEMFYRKWPSGPQSQELVTSGTWLSGNRWFSGWSGRHFVKIRYLWPQRSEVYSSYKKEHWTLYDTYGPWNVLLPLLIQAHISIQFWTMFRRPSHLGNSSEVQEHVLCSFSHSPEKLLLWHPNGLSQEKKGRGGTGDSLPLLFTQTKNL